MDTVSKKQTFTLPSPNNCEDNSASGTEIHLLPSVRKRIWLYFDTVKLTKLLFDFILGNTIKAKMYLEKKKHMKVMHFFYKCIGEQATRRMYMAVLVDICLVFHSLEQINQYDDLILASCVEGKEASFVSACKDLTVCYNDDLLIRRIKLSYDQMISRRRPTRYNSWQAASKKEIKYQSVRCMIFELWFQFKCNQGLKWKLYADLYPERVPRSVTQSSTKLVHKHVHQPPFTSTRENKRTKFPATTLRPSLEINEPNTLSTGKASGMDILLEAVFPTLKNKSG